MSESFKESGTKTRILKMALLCGWGSKKGRKDNSQLPSPDPPLPRQSDRAMPRKAAAAAAAAQRKGLSWHSGDEERSL